MGGDAPEASSRLLENTAGIAGVASYFSLVPELNLETPVEMKLSFGPIAMAGKKR